MTLRILTALAVALLAPLLLIAGPAAAGAKPPSAPPRIIAIGDLHGDFEAYEKLMREAGLINQRGKWAGGTTVFIQTGDVPDRGPDSLKIIKHLKKLQKQARRKGGKVITLVGNHEAMNMTGDLRYVHAGEYEAFETRNSRALRDRVFEANRETLEEFYLEKDSTLSSDTIKAKWEETTPLGMIEHQRAWRPDGDVGAWVAANPAVAIINGNLFVHGGISEKYTGFSVADMNVMTADALTERSTDPESIINDEEGPLWYRGLIREREENADTMLEGDSLEEKAGDDIAATTPLTIEEEINLVLAAFNVTRIVVGHTPALTGIKASHNTKLIQIDTGIAAYYSGSKSFLEIKDGVLYAHDNGETTTIGAVEPEGVGQ